MIDGCHHPPCRTGLCNLWLIVCHIHLFLLIDQLSKCGIATCGTWQAVTWLTSTIKPRVTNLTVQSKLYSIIAVNSILWFLTSLKLEHLQKVWRTMYFLRQLSLYFVMLERFLIEWNILKTLCSQRAFFSDRRLTGWKYPFMNLAQNHNYHDDVLYCLLWLSNIHTNLQQQ